MPQDWPGLGDPQLSKSNPEPWELRSIRQTMEDLGHKGLTVLKIDVEGAEWDALAAFLSDEKMMKLVSEGMFRQVSTLFLLLILILLILPTFTSTSTSITTSYLMLLLSLSFLLLSLLLLLLLIPFAATSTAPD